MPKPAEDRWFGGKQGAAREAYASMVKQYGAKKGEQVYYATLNRNRKKGLRGALARRSRGPSDRTRAR